MTASSDRQRATLVWITPSAEETIVHCARVSNPKSQKEGSNPDRLLRYLIKHKHWSPFEMASLCVEIETTRDVSAQILRHRSFSFQEFSQRYAEVDTTSIPEIELRYQDKTNRQSSLPDEEGRLADQFRDSIKAHHARGTWLYTQMLDAGVAKESARKILPIGSPSRLYMTGTIRSWIHYLQVRLGVETQKEHREVAEAIRSILEIHCPSIVESCNLVSIKPSV